MLMNLPRRHAVGLSVPETRFKERERLARAWVVA
jgi:hypothetical protein